MFVQPVCTTLVGSLSMRSARFSGEISDGCLDFVAPKWGGVGGQRGGGGLFVHPCRLWGWFALMSDSYHQVALDLKRTAFGKTQRGPEPKPPTDADISNLNLLMIVCQRTAPVFSPATGLPAFNGDTALLISYLPTTTPHPTYSNKFRSSIDNRIEVAFYF